MQNELSEAPDSPAAVTERCVPVEGLDYLAHEPAHAIAKAAMVGMADHSAWVGPLLEAIAIGAGAQAIGIGTTWGGAYGYEPEPNLEKHVAYVDWIERALSDSYPWILALFKAAGAQLIVGPGRFYFMVGHRANVVFDVPCLIEITKFMPWAEPGEIKH